MVKRQWHSIRENNNGKLLVAKMRNGCSNGELVAKMETSELVAKMETSECNNGKLLVAKMETMKAIAGQNSFVGGRCGVFGTATASVCAPVVAWMTR